MRSGRTEGNPVSRRSLLAAGAGSLACASLKPLAAFAREQDGKNAVKSKPAQDPALAREVGLTAATLSTHMTHRSQATNAISLFDLPRVVRDELDMRVIDLNTVNFPDFETSTLEKFRARADQAGCILTNLKLNQPDVNIGSPDPAERQRGLATFRESIAHAQMLGLRWVRPLPREDPPADMALLADSLRRLADDAAQHDLQVLIENFGWSMSDPDAAVDLIRAADCGLAASPDTGNWTGNDIRYAGLEKMFPLAVTCDFKARALGPNGEHQAYDLERCFRIGWESGFRGPWCIEHGNPDRNALFRELGVIRDLLRGWMA